LEAEWLQLLGAILDSTFCVFDPLTLVRHQWTAQPRGRKGQMVFPFQEI
jgi:hypothetical protein